MLLFNNFVLLDGPGAEYKYRWLSHKHGMGDRL